MKRTLLIIIFCSAMFTVRGEESVNTLILPEHAFGVTGGVNLSFFNFNPTVSQPFTTVGANVGLQYRMILEKYFGLWVQLNYDQRGFLSKVDGVTYTRRFDYVEMPIFAHFTFGKRLFRFHFDLGPSIGYMVHESGPIESSEPQLYLPVAHKFDWGVTGMVGFEFNTVRQGVYLINVRYNSSFANVFERDYDTFTISTGQSISISLGWMWRFKPKNGGYQAYDLRAKKKKE